MATLGGLGGPGGLGGLAPINSPAADVLFQTRERSQNSPVEAHLLPVFLVNIVDSRQLVFTQPGSKAEVAAFPEHVRCSPNN
jgi:hypothetical protein